MNACAGMMRLAGALVALLAASAASAQPASQHWTLGAGSYGATSLPEDNWSGFTDLDRARLDWNFVLLGSHNHSGESLNRLLKINPNLKFLVRLWPIGGLGDANSRHNATFLHYLFRPKIKQQILDRCSEQIHSILDTIEKPQNVVGFTFLEEIPMHFSGEETFSGQTLELPKYLEQFRGEIEADFGKPVHQFDEPLRLWWGKKFAQVVNEINAHIRRESGGKMVLLYVQTNHRLIDQLEEGESIVNPLILPCRWRDMIKPGVTADGFFAYANNEVIWESYMKLARENDWVFFSQLAAAPMRLASWSDALAMTKVKSPHNLGYFFYSEGSDRQGEWNDDTSIPLDDNYRRVSIRNRVRQHCAKEKIGMEIVNRVLTPQVQVYYDLRQEQRYNSVVVVVKNVRDRTWYLTPDEAALRDVKVSLSLPPGLAMQQRVSPPPTVMIDRIDELEMRKVTFWASRVGDVKIGPENPIVVTVEPSGVPPTVLRLSEIVSHVKSPEFVEVHRSGEFWHVPIVYGALIGQTSITFECIKDQATMPAVSIVNLEGVNKAIYLGTLRVGQKLVIGPGLKATLYDQENSTGLEVSDRLGGSMGVLSNHCINRIAYEDMDPPSAAPKLRIRVTHDGAEAR